MFEKVLSIVLYLSAIALIILAAIQGEREVVVISSHLMGAITLSISLKYLSNKKDIPSLKNSSNIIAAAVFYLFSRIYTKGA